MTATVTLLPMKLDDVPELARALVPYFAEIVPDDPADAETVAREVFDETARLPFWILRDGHRAGFALAFALDDGGFELAEFSIYPGLRRAGTGRAAMQHLLARLPGRWQLGVVATGVADRFWDDALRHAPRVRDLRRGPALTSAQTHSYTFTADGGNAR